MKNKKAFTLIEVLIALAIMASITAVSLPNLFRSVSTGLYGSLREINSYVDNLRFISITQGLNLQLIFDFDKQQVYVLSLDQDKWVRDDKKFKPIELPSGISLNYFKSGPQLITARIARVNFLPFGYVDQFQITLNQGQDKVMYRLDSVVGSGVIEVDNAKYF